MELTYCGGKCLHKRRRSLHRGGDPKGSGSWFTLQTLAEKFADGGCRVRYLFAEKYILNLNIDGEIRGVYRLKKQDIKRIYSESYALG